MYNLQLREMCQLNKKYTLTIILSPVAPHKIRGCDNE